MRIRIIDAFTDRPFAGNPAGVCLLDTGTWPDSKWMRRVAAELGHETAFAHPLPDGAGADWALRWFTPAAESNVCGHATLATAHALHTDRAAPLTVRFASQFGILIARTRHDGTITLDFPAAFLAEAPAPDGLAQVLGATIGAAYSTGALGDLLAIASDEAAVRGLRPDFTALARLTRRNGIRGIIVTAASADRRSAYDFVLPVLRTRRRHRRKPRHRQRPHRPRPLLVTPPRPRQPYRAADIRTHRPGPYHRPRRPGPPHRPRGHRPRRHLEQQRGIKGLAEVLADPELARVIDFGQPVCVILAAVLHFQPAEAARSLIAGYAAPLAAGSALLVSVFSAADEEFSRQAAGAYTAARWHSRGPAELERWLREAGLRPLRGHVGNVSTWPLDPPGRTASLAETIGDLAEKLLRPGRAGPPPSLKAQGVYGSSSGSADTARRGRASGRSTCSG